MNGDSGSLTPEKRSWWRRFLCALRDHGGITDIRFNENGHVGTCVRCGAEVEL